MQVVCRFCNEKLDKKEAVYVERYTKKGDLKKLYLHPKHKNEFLLQEQKIKEELEWWDRLYNYIRNEILQYDPLQDIPNYIITRLQDLRNGTIIMKGKGRVCKSKLGYGYDVILNTFLSKSDDIQYWINHKEFSNEKQKFNYIMAIIDSNINDIYIEMKRKKAVVNTEQRKETPIDINNLRVIDKQLKVNNEKLTNNSLLQFLDEEDL